MSATVIPMPVRQCADLGEFLTYDRARSLAAAEAALDQVIDEVLAERDETLERMAYIEFGDDEETEPGDQTFTRVGCSAHGGHEA